MKRFDVRTVSYIVSTPSGDLGPMTADGSGGIGLLREAAGYLMRLTIITK